MAAEPSESERAIPRTKLGAETYEKVAAAMRKARGDEIEAPCQYSAAERERLLITAQVLSEVIEHQMLGTVTRAVEIAEDLFARGSETAGVGASSGGLTMRQFSEQVLGKFADHVGGVVRSLEARVKALEANPLEYCGTFELGKVYRRGQFVTDAGCLWHCNANTTVRPGAGEAAWQLAVKKGRDAR